MCVVCVCVRVAFSYVCVRLHVVCLCVIVYLCICGFLRGFEFSAACDWVYLSSCVCEFASLWVWLRLCFICVLFVCLFEGVGVCVCVCLSACGFVCLCICMSVGL